FEKEFGKLRTNEIIITGERITHIKEHHIIDYELFEKYVVQCVQDPDYIIKDIKNKNTVFMIKRLASTNLNVISKLALDDDKKELKNSVMTFFRIREQNLAKLMKKNIILYKKE
ncbi:MAG: PBECR2 nuclease fold domain-containing protein, partial [Ruminococcus flavefaciens]|nr:PBECR2 nuclease fold domain-containing protein [Ruminococcus flavefaciens]